MTELLHAGIAINAYRSSPLRGCLTDLRNMREVLGQYGYASEVIADGEATRDGILQFLRSQVARVGPDGKLVVSYSGHGATGPSTSEADRTDECWVGQDMRPVWDNEIAALFDGSDPDQFGKGMDPDGQATIISDSCHSATVQRAVALGVENRGDGYRAGKYVPFSELADVDVGRAESLESDTVRAADVTLGAVLQGFTEEAEDRKNRAGYKLPSVWLFAACQADQVTYDALINGEPQGCYTRALIDALGELLTRHQGEPGWQPTNDQLHRAVRRKLPSEDYDNRPWAGGIGARSLVFAANSRR
jgi:hypothetical protein